jgi:carbamoyltransferase
VNTYILGISAYFHDSAAAILCNGKIIAAAQEERFSRIKYDAAFPLKAISFCLETAGIYLDDIEYIVFFDKPLLKFDRIISNFLTQAPLGYFNFLKVMSVWSSKLFSTKNIIDELKLLGYHNIPKILYTQHHQAHAAAAFFPSPHSTAAILCIDGVGEWATTSGWLGQDNNLSPLWQIDFPHSLGLFYSAFTQYLGFKVNSGEYKLMGLAPYGLPLFVDIIEKLLIDVKPDGSFRLNLDFFAFQKDDSMINHRFEGVFGIKARLPDEELQQVHMDIAHSAQIVTEKIIVLLANTLHRMTKAENLCLGGGVALNCVANGKLIKQTPFKNIWVQPAAGDAGSALGAAYAGWYQYMNSSRINDGKDKMEGAYLGPCFSSDEIKLELDTLRAVFTYYDDDVISGITAQHLAKGAVVGWFQDRMEFGPRALGNRSILGDPTRLENQSIINVKIKFRESFRPFAPAVLEEKQADYFDSAIFSPYMLFVVNVVEKQLLQANEEELLKGVEKLKIKRSSIPAVTHVDNSARIQTVSKKTNPKFARLIQEFEKITKCPMLINTSFNVRGEPIVCTPSDAYKCFMMTDMDYLVIGNFFLSKEEQVHNNHEYKDLHLTFLPD